MKRDRFKRSTQKGLPFRQVTKTEVDNEVGASHM